MAERKRYICPVCGEWAATEDRFPICESCNNEDVIIVSKDEIREIQDRLKKMSCDEQKKYLIKEPHDELDKLGLMTSEYIRQKYVFNDPRFSKTKFNERERALRERVAYIDAHKKEEIAALREEVYGKPNPYRKVTCPTCGSTNTRKISGLSKAASVGLFGIFSQKVKHQFHCNSCGYEW